MLNKLKKTQETSKEFLYPLLSSRKFQTSKNLDNVSKILENFKHSSKNLDNVSKVLENFKHSSKNLDNVSKNSRQF